MKARKGLCLYIFYPCGTQYVTLNMSGKLIQNVFVEGRNVWMGDWGEWMDEWVKKISEQDMMFWKHCNLNSKYRKHSCRSSFWRSRLWDKDQNSLEMLYEISTCGERGRRAWAEGGVEPQVICKSSLSWPHSWLGFYAPAQTSHCTKAVLRERSWMRREIQLILQWESLSSKGKTVFILVMEGLEMHRSILYKHH